jgi:hypothetical protein
MGMVSSRCRMWGACTQQRGHVRQQRRRGRAHRRHQLVSSCGRRLRIINPVDPLARRRRVWERAFPATLAGQAGRGGAEVRTDEIHAMRAGLLRL